MAPTTSQPVRATRRRARFRPREDRYGMVRETSEARRLTKNRRRQSATRTLQTGRALALMGIASVSHGDALALAGNSTEDRRA